MAVVVFTSWPGKETGQSTSMIAISTHMAIEHNYRILDISTNFNDRSIENAFWNEEKQKALVGQLMRGNRREANFDQGVEGLMKVIKSNRVTSNIVADYTKVVFRERFDVLGTFNTSSYKDYCVYAQGYPQIIDLAGKDYDLVFVDLSKYMPQDIRLQILANADIVVLNIAQRQKDLDKILDLRQKDKFWAQKKIMYNIGRYDKFSKFNAKNVARYLNERKGVMCVPYNTLYFEAASEALTADYFIKLKGLDPEDRNSAFTKELSEDAQKIIFKAQELQLRI